MSVCLSVRHPGTVILLNGKLVVQGIIEFLFGNLSRILNQNVNI